MVRFATENLTRARVERIVELLVLRGTVSLGDLAGVCNANPSFLRRVLLRLIECGVLSQVTFGQYQLVWTGKVTPPLKFLQSRGEYSDCGTYGDIQERVHYVLSWLNTEPRGFRIIGDDSVVFAEWFSDGEGGVEIVPWGSFQAYMGLVRRIVRDKRFEGWVSRLWRGFRFLFRM
jgi:hypothetical protein